MDIFAQLSLVILLAAGVALVMRFLKQPLIVGHILTGLIAGPYLLNLVSSSEIWEVLAKIGIATLLFIVGLNLSPQIARAVGKTALLAGGGQILLTFILGYYLLTALGANELTAAYLSLALAFSSTIIVLKLLTDQGELEKLSGRVAVGILLIQDIVAAVFLLIIPALSQVQAGSAARAAGEKLLLGAGAVVVLYLLSHLILPRLSSFAAHSAELLFLFSISWGLGLAILFRQIGFSLEIGALLAGVTLSASPYSQEMAARIKPIRDLFIILFFILLGTQINPAEIKGYLGIALVTSLFVIVGKPLIIFVLMNLLGHTRRNAFKTGVALGQISEFSLILITLGQQTGHVNEDTLTFVALIGLLSIAASTYLLIYENKIYPILEGLLKKLEVRQKASFSRNLQDRYDTILFGFHRVGQDFVEAFKDLKRDFIIVDFDPEAIATLEKSGLKYRYGDAEDVQFLDELKLKQVGMIVSTVPDIDANLLITKEAKAKNPGCVVVVVSHNAREAKELYQAGATYVVMPHYLGAQAAAKIIVEHDAKEEEYTSMREKHLKYLEKRTI